jgi:hypothetical protein
MWFLLLIIGVVGRLCCASSLQYWDIRTAATSSDVEQNTVQEGPWSNAFSGRDLQPWVSVVGETNYPQRRTLKEANGTSICAVTEIYCGSAYVFTSDTRLALDGKQCTLDAGPPPSIQFIGFYVLFIYNMRMVK